MIALHHFIAGTDMRFKESEGLEIHLIVQWGEDNGFMLTDETARERHVRELARILGKTVYHVHGDLNDQVQARGCKALTSSRFPRTALRSISVIRGDKFHRSSDEQSFLNDAT